MEEAHGDGPEGHMDGSVPVSPPRPQSRSSGPIPSGQGGEGSEEEGEIKSTTPLGNQDLRKDLDVKRSARQERRPDVGRELYLGEGAETPGGGGRGSVSNQETFRANAGGAGPLDSSGLADQRDRRRERPAPSSGGRGDGERDGELRPNGWGMRGGGGLNRDMIRRHDWHDREGRGGERMRDGARPGSVEGGGYVREHVDFDGARGREFGALGGRSSPLENDRGGPREMGRGRGGEGYYGPHDREGQGARDRDFESRGGGLFRGRGKNPSPGRGGQQREREWGREREMYDRGGLAPPRDNGRLDSWRGASFAKAEHPRAQHAGSGMFVRENTRHDEWRGAMGWFGAGNRREGSPPGQQLRPDNLYPPRDGGPDFSDVRSCTIRIARLPVDMQVDRLREELVQLARMHGRVSDVVIPPPRGELLEAFVTFVEPFMAEDARRQLHKLVFFDCRLDVELELPRLPQVRNGCADPRFARDHDLAAPRGVAGGAKGAVAGGKHHGDLDEDLMDDPLATCRLRISDLDPSVEEGDIAAVIKTKVGGGQIESILIRRGGGGVGGGCIAEVKMRSFTSSVRAKCELDGTPLLRSRGGPPRVEFRVGPPCPDLWLGSVHGSVEEHLIKHEFERFGKVLGVRILRGSKSAHVSFERTDVAEEALRAMRGRMLGSSSWRLKIDFWERGGEHGGGWSGVGGRKENREGSGWADEKGGGGRDRDMELEACRGESYGASPGKSRSGVEGRAGNPRGGSKDTGGLAGDDREPYLRDDALDQALGKRCRESSIRAGSWAVDKRPYAESGSHASMPYVEAEPAHNDKTGNGGSVRVRQKDPVPNALTPSGLDVGSAQQSALPSDAGLPSCERTVPSNPRFPVVWKGSVKLKSVSVGLRLHELQPETQFPRDQNSPLALDLPGTVAVTQRMRLEEEQINNFVEELRAHSGRHRTYIGRADDESEGVEDKLLNASAESAYFNAHLVKYLIERNVAGVVQLDQASSSKWDRLYLFPPSAFANMCISQKVPDLDMSQHENYLLVVILPR